jgi:putative lipase involved disintegration of autophagic bodies
MTGHSLGGGIALISGAQAHIKAVGLSAPNTVLGRDTVHPKLSLDDLQKWTFNIVPERGKAGCFLSCCNNVHSSAINSHRIRPISKDRRSTSY